MVEAASNSTSSMQVDSGNQASTGFENVDQSNVDTQIQNNGQTVGEKAAETAPQSWDTDARFESEWEKDPNKLYKAFVGHEEKLKEFESYQEQLKTYESKVSEFETYQEKTKPILDFLSNIADHPEYSKRFESFINDVKAEERRIAYGDLPEVAIEAIEKSKALEERLNKVEQEKQVAQIREEYVQKISDFDQFCKENGINWTAKNQFLESMAKTVQSPMDLENKFLKHIFPYLKKSTEQGIVSNIADANKRATFSSPAKSYGQNDKPKSFDDIVSGLTDALMI